jgi:putative membrane protein
MKRNIGKFAANIAAAGVLLGAGVVWADDQQPQQSSSSQDPSQQQAGQSGASAAGQRGEKLEAAGEQIKEKMEEVAADPQQFIKAAYQYNLFEVKAGQLAQQKAQNQETKDFAQRLVERHQQAVDKLKKLADQKNVQVSDELSAPRQRMLDELSSLSGADFDKKFMNQQLRSHKRALAMYKEASEKNTDTEVKQYAQQTIDTLRQHIQTAQQAGGISEPAGAQSEQGKEGKEGEQAQPK